MSSRRTAFNSITGCDEYRARKTGEVFQQRRLQWPDAADPATGKEE